MNSILTKIANATYDLFGILLPGLISLCIIASSVIITMIYCDVIEAKNLPSYYTLTLDTFTYVGIGFLILVSYMWGTFLTWLSRGPRCKCIKVKWLRILFILGIDRGEKDYDERLEKLKIHVTEKMGDLLGIKIEVTDWRVLYFLTHAYIQENTKNSLVAVYQNKYTFYKSISTACAIGFWTYAIGYIVVILLGTYKEPSAYLPPIIIYLPTAATCILMAYVFIELFEYFWTLLGSIIISESAITIASKDKNLESKK